MDGLKTRMFTELGPWNLRRAQYAKLGQRNSVEEEGGKNGFSLGGRRRLSPDSFRRTPVVKGPP